MIFKPGGFHDWGIWPGAFPASCHGRSPTLNEGNGEAEANPQELRKG